MKLIRTAAAMVLAALLVACGGGSGNGTGSSGQTLNAGVYSGHFVGPCILMPTSMGSNYETGAPLYSRTMLTIGTGTAASVPLASRFDFFDNASCSGEAIGFLLNSSTANALSLVSETTVNGRPAHKVTLTFYSAPVSYQPGPTADTVLYGSVLRLKLPRVLFSSFMVYEFRSLDGNDLYEGTNTYGPDEFPSGLLAAPTGTRVPSLPPLPETPCAPQTVSWYTSWGSCSAQTIFSASKVTTTLANTSGTVAGTAEFTCSNGTWSAPANANCGTAPVQTICPAHTVTWTSGALTCSGPAPQTVYPGHWTGDLIVNVLNTTTGNRGGIVIACQADGSWTTPYPGTCDVIPPPPPPITDPLQLAQAKNCLACHTVTGAGYSTSNGLSIPSFEQIANFYRNSPPAAGVLEAKIKAGGAGTFGTTPMTANPQVTDADLAILIPWILAQPQ